MEYYSILEHADLSILKHRGKLGRIECSWNAILSNLNVPGSSKFHSITYYVNNMYVSPSEREKMQTILEATLNVTVTCLDWVTSRAYFFFSKHKVLKICAWVASILQNYSFTMCISKHIRQWFISAINSKMKNIII